MIPVIDVSGLKSSVLADRLSVAKHLGAACRGIGFFYVTGHDVSDKDFKDLFKAARQFFALSAEQKSKLSFLNSVNQHGYMGFLEERLDLKAKPDRKESFGIGFELPFEDHRASHACYGGNQWPDIANWRDVVEKHFAACWNLGRLLHRGFSLDLGIVETFFDNKLDAPLGGLRLLHYPPATPDALEEDNPGAGEHTDYGNVTILAVDDVQGLQIRTRAGEWLDAPSIKGAVVCNIGDCLMRWTNDIYVSTPHRVKIPAQDRYSAAFFLDPNPDAEVVPVVGGNAARLKYPAISGRDYIQSRLAPTLR